MIKPILISFRIGLRGWRGQLALNAQLQVTKRLESNSQPFGLLPFRYFLPPALHPSFFSILLDQIPTTSI